MTPSPCVDRVSARIRFPLAALALALLLSACVERLPPCPTIRTQSPLEHLVRFVPGVPKTPENVLYEIHLADNALKCEYSDIKFASTNLDSGRDSMEVQLKLRFSVIRGPAASDRSAHAQYLVGVTDLRGNILNKEVFSLDISLPSRAGAVTEFVEENWMLFQLGGRTGLAFRIRTGLQLTDEELEFNRARGS